MKRETLTGFVIVAMVAACSLGGGGTWQTMVLPPATEILNDVWGSASDDVFAIGHFGTILHYDGDGDNDGNRDNIWEMMSSPTTEHLYGIWGTAHNNIYACGSQATLLHYDGSTWTVLTGLPSSDIVLLHDVWVTGSHVFAVGEGGHKGHIIHWDGSSWSHYSYVAPIPGWDVQLHAVWGRGPEDVYASGHACISADVEAIMYHYDGHNWEVYYHGGQNDLPYARAFTGIWCSPDSPDVFFAGNTYAGSQVAEVAHYDGVNWDTQVFPFEHFDSIWGSGLNNIYACARAGKILHYDGTSWSDMETGLDGYYPGLWGSNTGNVFAAGGYVWENRGLILRLNTPPIAKAGPDQTVYAWIDGMADVNLDGSDSNDPDGDQLTYTWTWTIGSQSYTATGVNPTIELPVGLHTIELVVNDGTQNSAPDHVVITVIAPFQANLWITPRVINRDSLMPNIMAVTRLPAGIAKDQIDTTEKLLLYPGEIEAGWQQVLQCQGRDGTRTNIVAFFNKAKLMDAVPNNGSVELKVAGQLKTGQYFYGTDTVLIINPPTYRPPGR